jgi:tyrosine-protein phosphatase YwqE
LKWFNFKKEEAAEPGDFSFLGTDMLSHLIPGIDDGSPDSGTSLRLIRQLYAMGYSKIITTPHIMQGFYNNTPSTILPGLELLRGELERLDIPVVIHAAAEYLLDTGLIDTLNADEPLLTLSGKKILVELSFVSPPLQLHSLLYQLQLKGYEPVIAHPERYKYYHDDPEQYRKLMEIGCELQLNLLSLTGHYGKDIKKAAIKLMDHRWPSYLGTDLHHERHAEGLQSLRRNAGLMNRLEAYPWKNNML